MTRQGNQMSSKTPDSPKANPVSAKKQNNTSHKPELLERVTEEFRELSVGSQKTYVNR